MCPSIKRPLRPTEGDSFHPDRTALSKLLFPLVFPPSSEKMRDAHLNGQQGQLGSFQMETKIALFSLCWEPA
jgi:hypothetical protein